MSVFGKTNVMKLNRWVKYRFYLLIVVEEAVLIVIKVGEHVVAFDFTEVIHMVLFQEHVDVVG